MSPQPLTTKRQGAFAMISVSAITASGASASIEKGLSVPFMDANGLAMPSCETVVGTLINGTFWLAEHTLAESIIVPPPHTKKDPRLYVTNFPFEIRQVVNSNCLNRQKINIQPTF